MATKSQLTFGPLPVHRVDGPSAGDVHKVDMPIEDAKQAIGRAVGRTLIRSGAALKEFGDKSQVRRWTEGENPNVARLWQREEVRRQFVLALAEECGMQVEVTVRMRA